MSLSIANRILIGFVLILALMAGIGFFAIQRIEEVGQTTLTIVNRDATVQQRISMLQNTYDRATIQRQNALQNLLLVSLNRPPSTTEDPIVQWRRLTDEMRAESTRALEDIEQLAASAITTQRAQGWRQIGQDLTIVRNEIMAMADSAQEEIAAIQSGNIERAIELENQLSALRPRLTEGFETVQRSVGSALGVGQERIAQINEEARIAIGGSLIAGILISAFAAYLTRRSIVDPLDTFSRFVERVGEGDLSGRQARTGNDEIGRLGSTLNAMVEGLRDLARQNREVTENLNAATSEIRASMQEQAASVEEQLAAVQETAATVDEITHAGSQVAKRAQEVIAAAQATAQNSTAGLQAVDETGRAMDAIREQAQAVAQNIIGLSEKTQAIGEIIMTVNDVSERSHLLALNAAIEAAAAGEQGRGFAVVAGEMKTLADQAKEATVQVRSILGDIQRGINSSVMLTEEAVKRVTLGKERADVTQTVIEEITERVQESVQTFQQIVASTNQQQLGIEQVMGALQNIRQASQQTAAGTRQLDMAAGNLSQLSGQLTVLAERYKI